MTRLMLVAAFLSLLVFTSRAEATARNCVPGENCTVMLLHILEDGTVGDVRVKKSSGDVKRDEAAVTWAKERTFKPAPKKW